MLESGARPTYLTTSEVAEDPVARSAMDSCLTAAQCEVGAHFHTWTREWPFPVPPLGNPPVNAMAHRLGRRVETAMLEFTKESLFRSFGVDATSYRGGRWSFGPSTLEALTECGIQVDSTYTPGLDWSNVNSPLEDGPDYRRAERTPHWLYSEKSRVLELPVGAAWFPRWIDRIPFSITRQIRRAAKLAGVRAGHRWLRPTWTSLDDMKAVLRALKNSMVPVWVIMIHSSEIAPCTVLKTEQDVDAFVARCAGVARAAVELGAEPATLTEAANWISNNEQVPVRAVEVAEPTQLSR